MSTVNEQNFARVLAEDGATAIEGESGGIEAIRFADGSVVAWRNPDDSGDRETQFAAKAVRAVAKSINEIVKVQADPTRTPSWKAEQTARLALEAQSDFGEARLPANQLVAEFEAADSRDSAPPKLAPGDAVAAALDREDRDEVRKLDAAGQTALAHELLAGKHPEILASLMRSRWPLPPALQGVLNEAWQRQRLASDPAAARLRRQAVGRLDWMRGVVEQSRAALPKLATQHPRDVELKRRASGD